MQFSAARQEETTDSRGLGILTMYMQEYGADLLDKFALHESIAEHFPGGLCAFDKNLNMTDLQPAA